MKITVIPKESPKQPEINLQDLKSGTVVTLSNGGIKALVITGCKELNDCYIDDGKKLVLLTNVDIDWFIESGGWAGKPIHSVLGKITEIIVKEI